MAETGDSQLQPPEPSPANPAPASESPRQFGDSTVVRMLAVRTPQSHCDWQPPSVEELQARLTQYEIRELIGFGGMGAVYKGWQRNLDRFVAIKILPNGLMGEEVDFAARFKREAKAMAKLKHPGLIPVHDAGETEDGLLYFVMDFVEGTDLQKMLATRGRLPPGEALPITSRVLDALAYAHQRGIIHRDIKPANIMVDADGHVLVADFGLARSTNSEATMLTASHVAMGTADFMAPESLVGLEQVDQRADLYAVGVMLYQMLTGKLPRGRFEPTTRVVPGLDKRLDRIIDRTLQQEREARYASAIELRADLDQVARRSGVAGMVRPRLDRRMSVFGVAAAIAVTVALLVFLNGGHETGTGTGNRMSARADDAIYPVGRWVDAWPLMKDAVRSAYQERDGWIVPSAGGLAAFDPRLAGRSLAIRATLRYGGDANHYGQVMARHQTTPDRNDREYRVRLKFDATATRLLLHDSSLSRDSSNEIRLAELPLPKPLAVGDAYTVQLLAMGTHLVAWYNGIRIGEATDARVTDGDAGILTGEAFRDFQVMNLDGLSEAEALKVAGMPATVTAPATAATSEWIDAFIESPFKEVIAKAERTSQGHRLPGGSHWNIPPFPIRTGAIKVRGITTSENGFNLKIFLEDGGVYRACIHSSDAFLSYFPKGGAEIRLATQTGPVFSQNDPPTELVLSRRDGKLTLTSDGHTILEAPDTNTDKGFFSLDCVRGSELIVEKVEYLNLGDRKP